MGNAQATSGSGDGTVARLAAWALEPAADDVAKEAREQAALLVLDTLGCAYAAVDDDNARAVCRVVGSLGGPPEATVIGSATRVSAPNAALANGCLARVLDLNDYVVTSSPKGVAIGGHPSDLIPAALAAGERAGCGGRDLLAVIVLGYETYGRAKGLLERRGAWDTASVVSLAAPVMAGRLLGLGEDGLAHAIALSAAHGPTSATVRTGAISSAKSLASGLVSQQGLQACLLAAEGLTGPLGVLDADDGLQAVFSQGEAGTALTAPLPADSYVMRAGVKAYPCVLTAQSAVSAAIEMHDELGWGDPGRDTDEVARVRVVMADYPTVRVQQADPDRRDPRSKESADHSFAYLVAVALLDGALSAEQFEGERWNDPQVRALMDKVDLDVDPRWNTAAPGGFPCTVRVERADGGSHEAEVAYPPGFSLDGLDAGVVIDKFRAVTARALDDAQRERVIDAVLALDDRSSCDELVRAVAPAARA